MPGFLLKAKNILKGIGTGSAIKDGVLAAPASIGIAKMALIGGGAAVMAGFLVAVPLFSQGSTQSLGIMQAVDPLAESQSTSSSSTVGGTSASGVVNCAREQIGKPYVWGAEGPDSFDCSGLVTYCYRQALSVEIGHYTGLQMTDTHFTTVLSVNELSAGDIILDGGLNPSHVGIYSGEGTVIHAPTFGDVVREVSLLEFNGWVYGNETYRHYTG